MIVNLIFLSIICIQNMIVDNAYLAIKNSRASGALKQTPDLTPLKARDFAVLCQQNLTYKSWVRLFQK